MFRTTHMQVEFLHNVVENGNIFPELAVWLNDGLHCDLGAFYLQTSCNSLT